MKKTVFPSKELPHVWAHQTQQCGWAKGRCNQHFNGVSYYSYSTEIARIIKRGEKMAYLVNETSYSHTTSGHQRGVTRAIPLGATTFYIGGISQYGCGLAGVTGKQIFEYAVKQAAECAAKAERSRKIREAYVEGQERWLQSAKEANWFFGLRRKVDEKTIERLRAAAEAERRKQAKERAEKQKRLEAERADQIQQWLNGEDIFAPDWSDRVRLRVKDGVLETSKGVRVPLKDAKRVYRFIRRYRTAEGWRRNGSQILIGDYQLDAVNENGVVAGCHRVDWEEIDRIAKQVGLLK